MKDLNIYSLDYIKEFFRHNYAQKQIKSITPYSFTVGSQNNGENIQDTILIPDSIFYGFLYLCINPNENPLQNEVIKIRYRSYFNVTPYYKYISRFVEDENYINENSDSLELFDELTIQQASTKYDFYLTFVGFKIDVK